MILPIVFLITGGVWAHETGHDHGISATNNENTQELPDTSAARIKLVGRFDPEPGDHMYSDVWGDGNYAFLGSGAGEKLWIVDLTDPTTPTLAGLYNTGKTNAYVGDIQARDGIAYLASFSIGGTGTGTHILDVTNPAKPVLLSRIAAEQKGFNQVHTHFVSGDFLYQADNISPVVKVFNVTNPASPVFVRDIRTSDPVNIHETTVIDGKLYTSGWGGTTQIYDVSNVEASAPRLISIASGITTHSTWLSENHKTLVTCTEFDSREVRLYDLTNPQTPVQTARFNSRTLGVDAPGPHIPIIRSNLLFVAWYQAGLQVFDIRNPARPVRVGAFDTYPGGAVISPQGEPSYDGCWGVYPFLGLDRILASDLDNGLFILDASALDAPDSDGDLIPNEWEVQYQLKPEDPADASGDPDHDGKSNLNEFLSQTNPLVADPGVRDLKIQKVGADVEVSFSPERGRSYAVQRSYNLLPNSWVNLADELTGKDERVKAVFKNGAQFAKSYYRVIAHP